VVYDNLKQHETSLWIDWAMCSSKRRLRSDDSH